MTKFKGLSTWLITFFAGMVITVPAALADGEFFQFDLAPNSSTMVGSVVRGNSSTTLALSLYDDGGSLSINTTYSIGVSDLGEGALIRVGPTARRDQAGASDLGAKVVFERWSPTDWGGVFLLADYNTIQSEYLFLAEASNGGSGLSASIAAQGDDDGFRENTLTLGYDIPLSELRLRLGYKFESEVIAFGISVNTF